MAKKGKKYRAAREKIEAGKLYTPRAGIELVKELASANFDETVEAHFLLGIDTRQADQQLRGSISLPNGIGKDVRVLVFAEGEKAREAEEAGADIVVPMTSSSRSRTVSSISTLLSPRPT